MKITINGVDVEGDASATVDLTALGAAVSTLDIIIPESAMPALALGLGLTPQSAGEAPALETLAIPGDPFPVTLQRDASGYSVAETGADFLAAYTGATWHVSPSGNDTTGDGSSGAPYATIGKAVTEASALDRIQL
ncbi:MAG: hypothetical protein VYD87_16490, partial [Pseudomonadota bacterium]|nr:hypothetical protein [Pseudomonadota bacterium]